MSVPKTTFVVPVYQRNYDWLDANCKQLFQDILKVISTKTEHFLGTICFKMYSSYERSIIDGQQRLTSITLLLKALYDLTDDEEVKDDINRHYLYNRGHNVTNDIKIKLHLNRRDDAVYHIILDNDLRTIESHLTVKQLDSRVYRNYRLFSDLLNDYADKGGNIADILDALRNITIIELEVQQENPQEIFESLNCTGLDLTNVDLLRNFFLMQFSHDVQTDLYDKYWSKIEDTIGVDNMEDYFVDYLVFKKRSDSLQFNGKKSHISNRTLYKAFRDYYNNLQYADNYEKTQRIFADLKDCAELYRNFIFAPDLNIKKESELRQKIYYLLAISGASQSKSILLYLLRLNYDHKINDKMLLQTIEVISSLTVRARLCHSNGMNRQFSGSMMVRLDRVEDYSKFIDAFWRAITAGKGSFAFPSDEDFKAALERNDIYNTLRGKGTKYLLYILEKNAEFHKELPPFDDSQITVEHIMPQTLNNVWKKYLDSATIENYEQLLHRLGNLTLTSYNSEMRNISFEEKKKIYKESGFHYTYAIADYPRWSSKEITSRSVELATKALKIWPLPKEYSKSNAPHRGDVHTLDEDFSQFAFTKPDLFMIDDKEYKVNSWSDLIPILCQRLIEDDSDAFMQIAGSEMDSYFVRDLDGKYVQDKRFAKIIDNIYARTAISAYETLNKILRIVKLYDQKTDSEYVNNILFTLKEKGKPEQMTLIGDQASEYGVPNV